MALMAAHGEISPMPDCAIFADTQAEPAAVYEHLKWLMSPNVLPFPVHVVTYGNLREVLGKKRPTGKYRVMPIPVYIKLESGKQAGMLQRACTRDYKINPLRKKVRELCGITKRRSPDHAIVTQWIGISQDEAIRMKPSWEPWVQHRWPLIELRMTRNDCLRWMEKHGYPRPPKSACTFCPFHDRNAWNALTQSEMQDAIAVDELVRNVWAGQDKKAEFFLHGSCKPLADVDLSDPDKDQLDLFNNECEGMCGV
jgi:hypothetical protein